MNTNKKIVEAELSYKILGVLFDVHKELGSALLEKHYQRAVAAGLSTAGLNFSEQVPVNLTYKKRLIGKYFLDFVIEGKVVLELKAKPEQKDNFFKQVLAYLKSSSLPLAIIANFRSDKLSCRRLVNPEFLDDKISIHSTVNSN